jgi:hypothetical protein
MTKGTLGDNLNRFVLGILSHGPILLGLAIITVAFENIARRLAIWRRPPALAKSPLVPASRLRQT